MPNHRFPRRKALRSAAKLMTEDEVLTPSTYRAWGFFVGAPGPNFRYVDRSLFRNSNVRPFHLQADLGRNRRAVPTYFGTAAGMRAPVVLRPVTIMSSCGTDDANLSIAAYSTALIRWRIEERRLDW
jgi:hypothetical protein